MQHRRQQTQLLGRAQRDVFGAPQQRAHAGAGLGALAFEHDQVGFHGDDFGLCAQGILLAAEAAGITGARYLGNAPHQVEVLLRDLVELRVLGGGG